MYSALSPGVIGVGAADLSNRIAMARAHGFGGVEVDIKEVADLADSTGAESVESRFVEAGVIAAGWHLPVDYGGAEEAWQRDLAALPRLAKAAASVECFRAFTWIMPVSNERPFEENLVFHEARFKPVAKILDDHGIRLGLEFIGPKTIRDKYKYTFVYDMPGMLDLAGRIGSNVGLLLDVWHLYTSHGTMSDVEKLEESDVVYVHVNDAPAGVAIDEQQDGTRCLPGETGVIDIAGFLGGLRKLGYSGPLVPEPFKKELNDLPSDEARLQAVAASMRKILGT